jgi:hypothetical protein
LTQQPAAPTRPKTLALQTRDDNARFSARQTAYHEHIERHCIDEPVAGEMPSRGIA